MYFCCLEVLERADAGRAATVTVREEEGALVFEVVEDGGSEVGRGRLRDRVEALGGRLTILPDPGGGSMSSGSLPLSG